MTLVELMIALLIGLLLSAAIITVYMSNKTTFWETEAAASMQDNALFAKRLIGDEIQHARFSTGVGIGNIIDGGLTLPNGEDCGPAGVTGLADLPSVYAVAAANAPTCLAGNSVKSGTDVLFIKRVAREAPSSVENNKIYFKPAALDSGQIFLGSLGISAINDAITGNADVESGTGSLREFIYRAYYVANVPGRAFPQLRRMSLRGNGGALEWFVESVADGIEDIHFQFGIDNSRNGRVDTYVTAAGVDSDEDWKEVHAVKMFMLTQSTRSDMGYTDDKEYTYRDTDGDGVANSTTVTGPYHRKLHQTTFMIPN